MVTLACPDREQFITHLEERQIAITGQSLPSFHSGGVEFSYFGKYLDEADGEPEETLASIAVCERTAKHLHDVLSGG